MGWTTARPSVGDRASRSREVGRRDIELFTRISGDRNPIHYDAELASGTPFGGIVVQGGVTTAILNAVVAEELPGPGSVFLRLDLRFVAPVRPGDTIVGQVVVTSVREDKPITGLDVTVSRGDGTLVVEGTAVCYTVALPEVPQVELIVDLPDPSPQPVPELPAEPPPASEVPDGP